jgi:hypothetical protein
MVLRRARKGDIVAVIGGVGTPHILRLCRGMKIVYELVVLQREIVDGELAKELKEECF